MTEDHTFVAQWKENVNPDKEDNDTPESTGTRSDETPRGRDSKKNKNPGTGDNSHPEYWIVIMILSMAILATIMHGSIKRRK